MTARVSTTIPGATGNVPLLFEPVLARLRSDACTHFDRDDLQLEPTHLHERVLSYVLRLAVRCPGNVPLPHLFVKIFKPRPSPGMEAMRARLQHDFDVTRRTHLAMASLEDLGAIRPVACYPDQLAIVTEETPGQTFAAYVESHARWFPHRDTLAELERVTGNVGRWVAAFQRTDPTIGIVSLSDLRQYIDVRLERMVLEPHAMWTAADRRRTLLHIDRLAATVPDVDLTEVIVHADLAPGNIIVGHARVVVLDFAMTRRGNRMHDITRLFTQLEMLAAKPQFRGAVIARLQSALVKGFDARLTDKHPLFRLLLLLHRVNHLNTLAVRRERLAAHVYSAHLRRRHLRWLRREVDSAVETDGFSL
jgi:aminoglycoside phosphotransferase (APT) family kinase protein